MRAHVPALRESLGRLVPRDLDPYFDDKPPKGKCAVAPLPMGLALTVGAWRVHQFDELGLASGQIGKGNVEMF